MSLPRQAVHVKLDFDVHADLLIVAKADDVLPAHWVERVVKEALAKEFHKARYLVTARNQSISSGKRGYGGVSPSDDKPESD